jgi:hypothetical protein
MYRTYLKSSLSTFDLINKNKYLPDGVKYCNGCCQDIRNLEEFSKVNKDGYCSVCRKCTNTIQLAKKKIKNGEFTVEEFKNDYTIMDDKTTDIDNELTLTCSSCKEDKSATQFDSAKRQCKACKSLSAIERNNKDMDIIYRDIDKLKFDHMIELKRYITQIQKDKLVKVISHYKIGRKSSDTKDRMIFNITEHFQLLSNPYKCAGKCGVTLTTQSTTCENCKRITKKEKVILSMVYFEDNVLPTITETLISKIDETTKWTYNKKQLIMIAHAFKLRPANKADRETIIEMINNKIDKINETKKREEAIEIIENKTEKLKEAKSVDISGVSIQSENNVENVKIVNMKKDNILTLNDIEIIARKSDGFINATQMCKAGDKQFNVWFRSDKTKELITTLESEFENDVNNRSPTNVGNLVVDIIKTGINEKRGSWIHPDLAVQLAQWISPAFAIKVSRWIRELSLTGSVTLNQEKTANELDNLWKQKLNKIQIELKQKDEILIDTVLQLEREKKKEEIEIKHKKLLKKRVHYKFKTGPCFYIISDIDSKTVRYKIGIDDTSINERLRTYRTSIPGTKLEFLIYTDKNRLIEQSILQRYEDSTGNYTNHEWIFNVEVDKLIEAVNTYINFANIKCEYEVKICEYNKDIFIMKNS